MSISIKKTIEISGPCGRATLTMQHDGTFSVKTSFKSLVDHDTTVASEEDAVALARKIVSEGYVQKTISDLKKELNLLPPVSEILTSFTHRVTGKFRCSSCDGLGIVECEGFGYRCERCQGSMIDPMYK